MVNRPWALLTRTLDRSSLPTPDEVYSTYPGDINMHHFLSLVQARRDGAALAPPTDKPPPQRPNPKAVALFQLCGPRHMLPTVLRAAEQDERAAQIYHELIELRAGIPGLGSDWT